MSKRKNRNKNLQISGKTEDGKFVIKNVFVYFDSRGIPLDIILEEIKERDFVVDWYDFLMQVFKAKRGIQTTLNQIYEAVSNVYCENVALIIIEKMKDLINNGEWDC